MSIQPRLLELVTLFNRQKTDLPDALIHNHCVFRLNGRAYHEQLGRSADDPLVRLVGCGPAGYRFLMAAIRHTVHEPRLTLHEESVREIEEDGATRLQAGGVLAGRLRGTEAPLSAELLLAVVADAGGHIMELAVTLGDADVEALFAARARG